MTELSAQEMQRLGKLLEQRLAALRDEIIGELSGSGEQHYIDLATRVADSGDQAIADVLADTEAAIVSMQFEEIEDVLAAQRRIAEGSIGVCIDCSEAIDFARLLAYPTAKRCLQCQEKHEHEFAHAAIAKL